MVFGLRVDCLTFCKNDDIIIQCSIQYIVYSNIVK